MTINISPKFEKSYRRLPDEIKKKAKEKELIFRENLFNPCLKTHKLSGKNKRCWAFWIDRFFRIKFIFLSKREVLFLDIGTHDIYK